MDPRSTMSAFQPLDFPHLAHRRSRSIITALQLLNFLRNWTLTFNCPTHTKKLLEILNHGLQRSTSPMPGLPLLDLIKIRSRLTSLH